MVVKEGKLCAAARLFTAVTCDSFAFAAGPAGREATNPCCANVGASNVNPSNVTPSDLRAMLTREVERNAPVGARGFTIVRFESSKLGEFVVRDAFSYCILDVRDAFSYCILDVRDALSYCILDVRDALSYCQLNASISFSSDLYASMIRLREAGRMPPCPLRAKPGNGTKEQQRTSNHRMPCNSTITGNTRHIQLHLYVPLVVGRHLQYDPCHNR
jgi:hypothetical protein